MTVFPTILLPFLLAVIMSIRSQRLMFTWLGIFLPFGASAVFILGSLSLIVAELFTVFMIVSIFVSAQQNQTRFSLSVKNAPSILILSLAAWGGLSALLLPQYFSGDVYVIPLSEFQTGTKVSDRFSTSLYLLRRTSSNLSQPIYMALSAVFFVFLLTRLRVTGARACMTILTFSGTANMTLGIADLGGLDTFISSVFLTGDYAILDAQTILGFDRIIGGFPEASAFGSFTVPLAAFWMALWIDSGKLEHAALGIGNTLLAVLSLSSAALAGAGALAIFLGLRFLWDMTTSGVTVKSARIFGLGIIFSTIFLSILYSTVDVGSFLDELLFDKADSQSGLERGFWASHGIEVMKETYGLGAGLGSNRANGLISVLLSNVGIPGLLLLAGFYLSIFSPFPRRWNSNENRSLFRACLTSVVSLLFLQVIVTTSANPGIFAMVISAMAWRVKEEDGRISGLTITEKQI